MMEVGFGNGGKEKYGPFWMSKPQTDKIVLDFLLTHGWQSGQAPVVPSGWIPVSERLPENPGLYIVYCGIGSFHVGNPIEDHMVVTHWQELPAPPKSEGGE